jgi:probable rRNA maturation factor
MSANLDLTVVLETSRWTDVLSNYEPMIQMVVSETLITLGQIDQPKAASIVLADDEFLQKYNLQFRGKDKPTNVLSFPADKSMHFVDNIDNLGDILISLSTLEREAAEQEKTFEDHFKHMLVHGVLHLLGHDHQEDEEAEKMETLEITILLALGVANPYEHKEKVSC